LVLVSAGGAGVRRYARDRGIRNLEQQVAEAIHGGAKYRSLPHRLRAAPLAPDERCVILTDGTVCVVREGIGRVSRRRAFFVTRFAGRVPASSTDQDQVRKHTT
jgi:hypothetical protein